MFNYYDSLNKFNDLVHKKFNGEAISAEEEKLITNVLVYEDCLYDRGAYDE